MAALFPTPDLSGTVYQLQVGHPLGYARVLVSLPGDPDIAGDPGIEDAVKDFAAALAEVTGGPLYSVTSYRTSRTDVPLAP